MRFKSPNNNALLPLILFLTVIICGAISPAFYPDRVPSTGDPSAGDPSTGYHPEGGSSDKAAKLVLKTGASHQDPASDSGLLECLSYDERIFGNHILAAEPFWEESLSAGIVPHHLLAGELIASFYLTAANTGGTIDTVIVLGPDHGGKGGGISLSDCGWSTEYGIAECDAYSVSRILSCKSLKVSIDNELLQGDHAGSSQIPYIKYYLPDAKVVTLLLSRKTTREQENDLAGILYDLSREKNVLVVGSVDFSHGLPSDEAKLRDIETLKAISDLNYTEIKNMSNEYLDSPETLNVLLRYTEMRKSSPQLLSHKSAADYSGDAPLRDCTTYFVFLSP